MQFLLKIKQVFVAKVTLPMMLCLFSLATVAQDRVMLFADPHVLASSLVEQGAAMDEMMAGQRKMLDLSEEVFLSLIDTALAHKPALLLIPGDLTKSHNMVAEQLRKLQASGINVLVVPGNHDIGANAYAYRGNEAIAVDVSFASAPEVSSEKYATLGGGAMIGYAPSLDYEMSRKLSNIAKEKNISILDAIVKTGIASSKGQAKTLIAQGGVTLNDVKVEDIGYRLSDEDFKEGYAIIKKGKKVFHKLEK